MKVTNLKLKNFRNHTNAEFEFDAETTLITGRNGAGKTNILEAIYILSGARSQRTRYDRDLIQFDKPFATITGKIENSTEPYTLEIQIIANSNFENMSSKKAKLNKVTKSMAEATGIFTSVLFSPQDINIITGPPSDRRKLLDSILSVSSRGYKRSLDNYTKALRQRNKLLEQILETGNGKDQLGFWTEIILKEGLVIQELRKKLIDFFNERINTKLTKVNGHKQVTYNKNEISEERLEKYSEKEILAKSTLVGPHRDDFSILSNDRDLAEFGSRGQQREAMFGLKLCEIDYLETSRDEKPILLLDDIFSEFDKPHQEMVMDIINGYQTIITNTDIPEFITDKTRLIKL